MTKGEKEDERVRAEEKYKALVETAPDAIFTLDLLGRFTFANPAAERISGYGEEELVGRHFRKLLPLKHIPACLNVFQKALRGQPTPPIEIEMITKQGERVPLELLGRPVKRGRRIVEILGIARDITERKEALEALRRHGGQLAALRQVGLELTAQLDLDRLLDSIVSRAVELLKGTAGGLYLCRPEPDVLEWAVATGANLAPVGSVLQRGEGLSGKVWETGGPFIVDDYQHWEGRADVYQGYPFTAVVGVPVRWGEEFLGVLNVLADAPRTFSPADAELLSLFAIQAAIAIHNARLYGDLRAQLFERKRAEEELKESEEKFRSLAEQSPNMIFINKKGRVVYADEQCEKVMGYTREEFYSPDFDFLALIAPEHRDLVKASFGRHMKGEEVGSFEYALLTRDDKRIEAILTTRLIDYEGEKAILGIVTDITEQKRVEEALRESEARFRLLFEASPDPIFVEDLDGNVLDVNPAACRLHGMERKDLIGKNASQLVPPDRREDVTRDVVTLTKGDDVVEGFSWTHDGRAVPVEIKASPIDYKGQRAALLHVRNVTERKRAEEEIRRRSKELAALYDVSLDLAARLDLDTLLKTILLRAIELLRANGGGLYLYDPGRQDLELIVGGGLGKDYTGTRLALGEGACGRVAQSGEPLVVTDYANWEGRSPHFADEPTVNALAVPIKRGDTLLGALYVNDPDVERRFDDGDVRLSTLFANQAAIAIENVRLYEETQQLAMTDGLTGLYNLRHFYETLEKEIQRSERYHRSVSLIILDIDDFKAYNDLHGHLAGDDLLKELAQLMSKVTRQTDTLARYGGEEFAIILPETDTGGARFLAERLLEQVREHRSSIENGQTIGRITISLGVATYPDHADGAKALVDAADSALLQAKREGKHRLCVCEASAASIRR